MNLTNVLKTVQLDVRGITETSFLDWDGYIVTTLYVPYCNFRCPFCHNFELIENPSQFEKIDFSRIESFLLNHKNFIDGVCLTGGEPCLHKNNGLFEFFKRIKEIGFKTKLDTNGSDPQTLRDLINQRIVDYIAMDIKGPLNQKYDKLSGIKTNLDHIKQSIKIIMNSNIDYEFRTTVVPTLLDINDTEEISRSIYGAKRFVLQQFVPKNSWDVELRRLQPYSRKVFESMREVALCFVKECIIRGV